MKIECKGQFFYVRTGADYVNEIPAEEWSGEWHNIDDRRSIEIIYISQITQVSFFPDLLEVHVHSQGRKMARHFRVFDSTTYEKFIAVLQSGLNFDLT
jgi:hypothetical protein